MASRIERLGQERLEIGPKKKLRAIFPPNTVEPLTPDQMEAGKCEFCEEAKPIINWRHRPDPNNRELIERHPACGHCLLYASPWGKNRKESIEEVISGLEEEFGQRYMRDLNGRLVSTLDVNRVVFAIGHTSDMMEGVAAQEISPLQVQEMLGRGPKSEHQTSVIKDAFGVEHLHKKTPMWVLVTPNGNFRLTDEQAIEYEENPIDHCQVCPVPDSVRAECEQLPYYIQDDNTPKPAPSEAPKAPPGKTFEELFGAKAKAEAGFTQRLVKVEERAPAFRQQPTPNWINSTGIQAVIKAQKSRAIGVKSITASQVVHTEPKVGDE